MESQPFDLSKDIPHLQGKVFLVTGGESGSDRSRDGLAAEASICIQEHQD